MVRPITFTYSDHNLIDPLSQLLQTQIHYDMELLVM